MSITFSSILAAATNPLFLAGVVIVAGFFGARYWQGRSCLARLLLPLLVFVALRGLRLAGGGGAHCPRVAGGSRPRPLFVGGLGIIWWVGPAARAARSFA